MNTIIKELFPELPKYCRSDKQEVHIHPKVEKFLEIALEGRGGAVALGKATLVSSFYGKISKLLFTLPSYATDNELSSTAIKSLISELPKTTNFVVVHHNSNQECIRQWFVETGHPLQNIQFVPMSDDIEFTDWAEDPYVSAVDLEDGNYQLIEPYSFSRSGDQFIADEIESAEIGIAATQKPLVFEGGNCLICDTFWLLGWDYISDTIDLFKSDHSPVSMPAGSDEFKFVSDLFGNMIESKRKLIHIGTQCETYREATYGARENGVWYLDCPNTGTGRYHPIFHIDMFITPLGRGEDDKFRFLVGCPRLGANLTGQPTPYARAEAYDEIANNLRNEGFIVIRNPIVHRPRLGEEVTLAALEAKLEGPDGDTLWNGLEELRALGAKSEDKIRSRNWYHITWNNCLVENAGAEKCVYLPTFGHGRNADLKKLDDCTEELFESEGFKVKRLADFDDFAQRDGVVHCITKYLQRG